LQLSARDIKCIRSTNFLKFTFKGCERIFSNLLFYLNYQDEDFTYESCIELTKSIDDITIYNDTEFIKLANAILPLLGLKDSFQRLRFEILIGFPQLVVEENPSKYHQPLISYHVLSDDKTKHTENRGLINVRNTMTLLQKLYYLRPKGTTSIQVFLQILEACVENPELLKYIRNMPADEPRYGSFIDYGVIMINTYVAKSDNSYYYDRLTEVVNKINPLMDNVINDNTILSGHNGFIGKYLIKDIKREEITLLKQIDNIYLFEIEYFANTIPLNQETNYTKSKSYINGSYNILDDKVKIF
jgi:hypothetical protein